MWRVNNHHRSLCPQKFGNLRKESAYLVEELSIQEVRSTTKDELVTSSNKDRMFNPSNEVQEDKDSTESVLISSGETGFFLQIGLNESQKDVTRFFWLTNINNLNVDNNIQVFRLCTVPFGIISSPFWLSSTLDFHLKMHNSTIADKIRRNIYVDNVITGTESTEDGERFYRESKEILTHASMNLHDWTSNDTSVTEGNISV